MAQHVGFALPLGHGHGAGLGEAHIPLRPPLKAAVWRRSSGAEILRCLAVLRVNFTQPLRLNGFNFHSHKSSAFH